MYDLVPIEIAASGAAAQRVRMAVIASNLANAQSTRNADGTGPYQRRMVVVRAATVPAFEAMLQAERVRRGPESDVEPLRSRLLVEQQMRGVIIQSIERDPSVRKVFEPEHPDADGDGYVTYPDISIIQEMTDMIAASRNFEANAAVIGSTREMVLQLLDVLGK
jgi:flagellar basal-body rod protein FlgC